MYIFQGMELAFISAKKIDVIFALSIIAIFHYIMVNICKNQLVRFVNIIDNYNTYNFNYFLMYFSVAFYTLSS